MNVYEERIYQKFEGATTGDAYNASALLSPCLILLHPSSVDGIATVYRDHRDEIDGGSIAVLVVGTSVWQPPHGASPNFLHCLSYGIPSPCRNQIIIERFKDLVKRVRSLQDWSTEDMRTFWEIVDPPYPEYLIAWHLVSVAKQQGINITEPEELEEEARREFNMRCSMHKMTDIAFNRAGILKLFSQLRS